MCMCVSSSLLYCPASNQLCCLHMRGIGDTGCGTDQGRGGLPIFQHGTYRLLCVPDTQVRHTQELNRAHVAEHELICSPGSDCPTHTDACRLSLWYSSPLLTLGMNVTTLCLHHDTYIHAQGNHGEYRRAIQWRSADCGPEHGFAGGRLLPTIYIKRVSVSCMHRSRVNGTLVVSFLSSCVETGSTRGAKVKGHTREGSCVKIVESWMVMVMMMTVNDDIYSNTDTHKYNPSYVKVVVWVFIRVIHLVIRVACVEDDTRLRVGGMHTNIGEGETERWTETVDV